MVPAIKPFLQKVKLDTGVVIIDPIEGMFELDPESGSDVGSNSDSGPNSDSGSNSGSSTNS